jgi:hypothetical protein
VFACLGTRLAQRGFGRKDLRGGYGFGPTRLQPVRSFPSGGLGVPDLPVDLAGESGAGEGDDGAEDGAELFGQPVVSVFLTPCRPFGLPDSVVTVEHFTHWQQRGVAGGRDGGDGFLKLDPRDGVVAGQCPDVAEVTSAGVGRASLHGSDNLFGVHHRHGVTRERDGLPAPQARDGHRGGFRMDGVPHADIDVKGQACTGKGCGGADPHSGVVVLFADHLGTGRVSVVRQAVVLGERDREHGTNQIQNRGGVVFEVDRG